MDEMTEYKRIGMFHVKSDQLRDACLPFPQRIVDSIRVHLPRLSCSRNEGLLNTIKVCDITLRFGALLIHLID